MEELELQLEVDLRRLQKASLKQMGSFQVDLQLGDTPEKVADQFSKLGLHEALRDFALLANSRDPNWLRTSAKELAKNNPLSTMMAAVHLDAEGRIESKSAGAPIDGEPDESWYRHQIGQMERLHRARAVGGWIEPARVSIHAQHGISERHFDAIIGLSPFIPDSQKPIVARGFARLFQGDFISAAHLLIPQLEPCLRHLLKIEGHDPSKRRDDGTEEDLSLSNLFLRFRQHLDQVLTPAIAFEIELLFVAKPGPELRNELAHGQIGAGQCYHPDVYYACWLIYRLCCLMVMGGWDQFIAPHLRECE